MADRSLSFAVTDAPDTATMAARVPAQLSMAVTDAPDVVAVEAGIVAYAALGATEAIDTMSVTAGIKATLSMAVTDTPDSMAFDLFRGVFFYEDSAVICVPPDLEEDEDEAVVEPRMRTC